MSQNKKSKATVLNAVTMAFAIMSILVIAATVIGAVISDGIK